MTKPIDIDNSGWQHVRADHDPRHDHAGPGCEACARHWYQLGLAHGRLEADAEEARAVGIAGELVSFLLERAGRFATDGDAWAQTTSVPDVIGGGRR